MNERLPDMTLNWMSIDVGVMPNIFFILNTTKI